MGSPMERREGQDEEELSAPSTGTQHSHIAGSRAWQGTTEQHLTWALPQGRRGEESASTCTCPARSLLLLPTVPPAETPETGKSGLGPEEGVRSEHPPSADGQGEEV